MGTPRGRLDLLSNRNLPSAIHAAASHPIAGLPEKLGCDFSVCQIWGPAEVLVPHDCGVPAPSLCMLAQTCLPK